MAYLSLLINSGALCLGLAPAGTVHQSPQMWWMRTAMVMAVFLFSAIALAVRQYLTLRRMERLTGRLWRGAERFARGRFDQEITPAGSETLQRTAQAMNRMAAQMQDRLRQVIAQRRELEVVLTSMSEGVLAIDADERVLTFNRAAQRLLNLDPRFTIGRGIVEVIRHAQLRQLVTDTLATGASQTIELDLSKMSESQAVERRFEVRSSLLEAEDSAGGSHGILLVFNDVTTLHQLESIRRDFVSNASHEMRTPLAAIKAAVETLEEDVRLDPAQTRNFFAILHRHADRMFAILEDLLTLANVEQQSENQDVALEPCLLRPMLEDAAESCRRAAQERDIRIALACPPELTVQAHRILLEQAVVNLLENAIKYGPASEEVELRGLLSDDGGEIRIEVEDHGEGIAPEHQLRIFERFYRVDKGRSRRIGSTGLGLAIVKHICQAHHGSVSVQSRVGWGSTFIIHLPASPSV